MVKYFDVIIIGAGPAGATTAIELSDTNLKILIIDKENFPRKKTCGDAISIDVINQLKKLKINIYKDLKIIKEKNLIEGFSIFSPNKQKLNLTLKASTENGYVISRSIFDNILFNKLKTVKNITVIDNEKVKQIYYSENKIVIKSEKSIYQAKIIIGADGAYSSIARKLANTKPEPNHFSIASQAYFQNVTFASSKNIELYFFKDVLPGYFWIFPAYNNVANVGVGILASKIKKENIDLNKLFNKIIKTEFKNRFSNSIRISEIKTRGLPLCSKIKDISGDRFLLVGDAASLIDPFLGEGIGNAIRSGRFAAKHIIKSFNENKFDAEFNKKYDNKITKLLQSETKRNYLIMQLLNKPFLINIGFSIMKKLHFLSKIYSKKLIIK